MYNSLINHFYPFNMFDGFFCVNIFISTEGGIAEELLLFKINFVIILNPLIILIWRTYQHIMCQICSKLTIKTLLYVIDVVLLSLLWTLNRCLYCELSTDFTRYFSVSIFDYGQVNASWVTNEKTPIERQE